MKLRYNIRRNWVDVAGLIGKHPVVLLPFLYVAFFELLILETAYFASMRPLAVLTAPIIRKFLGEEFLHYPGSIYAVPQLFYYADMAIYIFLSVYMTAVSVGMFKKIKAGLPVKVGAVAGSVSKRYAALVLFGTLMIGLMVAAKKVDMLVLKKLVNMAGQTVSYGMIVNGYLLLLPLSIFIVTAVLQAFTIITVPAIVMRGTSFLQAVRKSVSFGLRNFFTLFSLIFVPFLAYLPVIALKSRATELSARSFPGLCILLTAAGVLVSVIVDPFILLCASQFLLDTEKKD